MSERLRFNKKLARITFPRLPAHKTVGDYLSSKEYLSSLEYRNYEWDKAGHEPHLDYYITKRVLQEANQRLRLKTEWAKNEYAKIDLQWKNLEEEELKFQGTFSKMNEFIKSNEDKRARAEIKQREDCALKIKRIQDTEILQHKIDTVVESKQEMDGNIGRLHMFEEYLNGVVGLTTDFINADDILGRYEALVTTKNLLAQKQETNLTELEMAKFKITKLSEEYAFKALGLNNTLADLQSRYSLVTRQALHWEHIVLKIKKECFDKYRDLNKVLASIFNLYLLMCKRKGETPKLSFKDTEQMLIYIKKTFQEVSSVKQVLRAKNLGQKK